MTMLAFFVVSTLTPPLSCLAPPRCGNNYGWRRFEGDRCMQDVEDQEPNPQSCLGIDRSPFTSPIFK